MSTTVKKHYKQISFRENGARLKLLQEFRDLISLYFENSTLNMLDGNYSENEAARLARGKIRMIIKKSYELIRLADVKTSAASTSSLAHGIKGRNLDLIMNIFNLGRNNIPPETAIEYIDEAIDVYSSNRFKALLRTVNPLFWLDILFSRLSRKK